jgi:hypothetical protein
MRPPLYSAACCALLGCGSAFRFKFVWHAMQICPHLARILPASCPHLAAAIGNRCLTVFAAVRFQARSLLLLATWLS